MSVYQKRDTPSQITTPVLVIGFNRPDKMEDLLTCLVRSGIRRIFVSLDGPRIPADEVSCKATREMVEKFSSHFDLKMVWREQNLGCNLGVVAALDWFFQENEIGIILEDDCLPVNSMFELFEEKLHLISQPNSNIGLITAHNPFKSWPSDQISNYVFIHGWATNSRVWHQARHNFFKLNFPQIRKCKRKQRPISESFFWWANSTRARLGTVDTWDGIFYDQIWRLGLKTWVPSENRITNTGFDLRATHTKNTTGSNLVELEMSGRDNFDLKLRNHYFKIRRRHAFTAPVKVFIDIFRGKIRKFEIILINDLASRKHYP